MALAPGTKLGPYEVLSAIGAGGMGEVYKARDPRLGRTVAVKVLPPEFAREPDRLARFEQEARTVSGLNHPNVLAVHDVGEDGGRPYLVTELLEGETLRARLAGSALPVRKAVEVAIQISAGLEAAHARGVVHRDLKPENVFLTRDGLAKVLDFGLARRVPDAGEGGDLSGLKTADPVTAEGVVLGTVGYMSPEQVRGRQVDRRSDIFSLGVVVHEMLSGERAFRGDSAVEVMNAILKESPPDVSTLRRDVPPGLDGILRRCLEKSPDDRFSSARDVGYALEALSSASGATAAGASAGGTSPRRRLTLAAAVATGLACLAAGAGGALLLRPSRPEVPAFHQLTSEPGYAGSARFSRDGATVVFSGAWNGRANQLFSIRTTGQRAKGMGIDADVVGISSSGDMAVILNRRFLGSWLERGTLARLPVDGGTPRPILDDVFSADISADGASFTVVRSANGRQRLEYPPGKILFDTPGWISDVRFSPRGDAIGFLEHPLSPDDRGFVAIAQLKGGVRRLTGVYVSAHGLAFTPDGREIWYGASAAGEDNGLWAVSLDGRVRPVLRAPIEVRVQDISPGGDVLVASDRYQIEMGVQEAGSNTVHDLSWNSTTDIGTLSVDGRQLVFSDYGDVNGSDYAVYLQSVAGEPPVYIGPGYGAGLSPDGRFIAASVLSQPHVMTLYPTGPGETRTIALGPLENHAFNLGGVTFSKDGGRFLFTALAPDGHTRDYLVEIATGRITPVTPPDSAEGMLAPDGRRVLTYDERSRKALLVDLAGGPARAIDGVAEGERIVGWGADSRSVFVWDRTLPARVFRLDVETGRREPLLEVHPQPSTGLMYGRILVAQDGRSAAYRVRRGLSAVFVAKGLR